MIDWLRWGPLIFKRARAEDRPIFLLISTESYWSRVCLRQISKDERVADVLKQSYIAVHLDATEYPDVSQLFLKFIRISTGRAGCPLMMWLRPDGLPLMGASNMPFEDEPPGKFGLITHLKIIAHRWREPRWEDVNEPALERLKRLSNLDDIPLLSYETPEEYMIDYAERWILRVDPNLGGFSSPLKFPLPLVLSGLLGVWDQLGEPQHLHVVEYSLEQMLRGSIYDHIGGGVWRYSAHDHWNSACYEKELTDQCHLILALTSLYQITQLPKYSRAIRSMIRSILREFRDPRGGFVSTVGLEDHDLSRSKNTFSQHSWSEEEVYELLDAEDAEWFIQSFLAHEVQSKRETEHGGVRRIPRLMYSLDEDEARYWDSIRPRLEVARRQRYGGRPHRSSLRVCSHNSLAAVTLMRASVILDEPQWFRIARSTLTWISTGLWDGLRLSRAVRGEHRLSVEACLEDYMSTAWALSELALYVDDSHSAHLAEVIFDQGYERFKDQEGGGFFQASPARRSLLPVHEKPVLDTGDLSGNAWALLALERLYTKTRSSLYQAELVNLADQLAKSAPGQMTSLAGLIASLINQR